MCLITLRLGHLYYLFMFYLCTLANVNVHTSDLGLLEKYACPEVVLHALTILTLRRGAVLVILHMLGTRAEVQTAPLPARHPMQSQH